MTSATITIDAGLLAVPHVGGSTEDVHGYVERILDWAKLLDEPWIALCMSEHASGLCRPMSYFRSETTCVGSFSCHGIREYDVNTVATVINRLLQHTPSFETCYRVRETLSEDSPPVPM